MRTLALLLPTLSFLAASPLAFAQSPSTLLEGVKRNPEEAREMCNSFQTMNAAGKSALTPESIQALAKQRGLSYEDAEIVGTYVIGLHCQDVF